MDGVTRAVKVLVSVTLMVAEMIRVTVVGWTTLVRIVYFASAP